MDFEDKLDCKIPVDYESLSDEEIISRYREQLREKHPNWTRLKVLAEARYWFNKGLLRNKEHIENIEEHYWKEYNQQFGVLSLTIDLTSFEMWEKYASNHAGFCVGFDPRMMLKDKTKVGAFGLVEYFKKLPTIHPFEDSIQRAFKQIYYKEDKWKFEKEYRVHKLHPKKISSTQRLFSVPEEAVIEIVFGACMKEEHKLEIIEIAKVSCKNAKFKQASVNFNEKEVRIEDYLSI